MRHIENRGEEMNSQTDFRKQLYETALSAGLPIISGDKCCQLLAWLYIYGGANEQTVFNEKLRNAIFSAQQRLNINGGEVPDMELTPVMQNYIKSVSDYNNPPEWIIELEKEYGLKPNREDKK
jgi:hypothetical protein